MLPPPRVTRNNAASSFFSPPLDCYLSKREKEKKKKKKREEERRLAWQLTLEVLRFEGRRGGGLRLRKEGLAFRHGGGLRPAGGCKTHKTTLFLTL